MRGSVSIGRNVSTCSVLLLVCSLNWSLHYTCSMPDSLPKLGKKRVSTFNDYSAKETVEKEEDNNVIIADIMRFCNTKGCSPHLFVLAK